MTLQYIIENTVCYIGAPICGIYCGLRGRKHATCNKKYVCVCSHEHGGSHKPGKPHKGSNEEKVENEKLDEKSDTNLSPQPISGQDPNSGSNSGTGPDSNSGTGSGPNSDTGPGPDSDTGPGPDSDPEADPKPTDTPIGKTTRKTPPKFTITKTSPDKASLLKPPPHLGIVTHTITHGIPNKRIQRLRATIRGNRKFFWYDQ